LIRIVDAGDISWHRVYANADERQADGSLVNPTGDAVKTCLYCAEPIASDDFLAPDMTPPAHFECGLRAIVGGVNHQKGTCSCCGGTDPPDPPDMTPREAARAAALYFKMHPFDFR
jgi:hypothetical protein